MGTPRKEQPLWRSVRQRPAVKGHAPVVVKGRNARVIAEQLQQQQRVKRGLPPAVAGPVSAPRAFRFRYQLIPLAWLAAAGAGFAVQRADAWPAALLAYPLVSAAVAVLTRHLPPFPRKYGWAFAAWMCAAGVISSVWGLARLPDAALLAIWAILAARWVGHYGWRPPRIGLPVLDTSVHAKWMALCETQRWAAHLGPATQIDNGEQFRVVCDGTKMSIKKILAQPESVAAAFDKPVTEAYVEPDKGGIQSRGTFTMLRRGTLDPVRRWDGATIDPDTGLAVLGRFPDGKPVRQRWLQKPRDGIKHTLIVGTTGSGKTGGLDLNLSISATSGLVCPVILDPQYGQALPAWREHVIYACGPDECLDHLYALHCAMMDRSELLGSMRWIDDKGRARRGMGFYNPDLCGLPIVEITIDEAPILIALRDKRGGMSALQMILDIAKLGRKVGFRLVLAAQVPSISELGKGELRSQLVGGNGFCLRTGDKVTNGMMGIKANPSELPEAFADGSPTYGLGYADTMDGRAGSPMRLDFVPDPYEVAEQATIRRLDDRAAGVVARVLASQEATTDQLSRLATQASDAELRILQRLRQGPLTRGEIVALCQPLPMSEIVATLPELVTRGTVRLVNGDQYELVPQ